MDPPLARNPTLLQPEGRVGIDRVHFTDAASDGPAVAPRSIPPLPHPGHVDSPPTYATGEEASLFRRVSSGLKGKIRTLALGAKAIAGQLKLPAPLNANTDARSDGVSIVTTVTTTRDYTYRLHRGVQLQDEPDTATVTSTPQEHSYSADSDSRIGTLIERPHDILGFRSPPLISRRPSSPRLWIQADEDQGNEAIFDVLLRRPRSELGHGVNISINTVVKRVTKVLSKSNRVHDQLLGLSAEEAQCTLDFLQDLLDISDLPMISKRMFLKTSLKLTRTHDCVPQCLMLRGFKKTGDYPFALGHFGELWRGEIEGKQVAVKQARIFTSDNNINKVLREVRREAIIWRQCDHTNVLPFYGIYRDPAPSAYCLVSPFMVNGSLRQYMNKTDDFDRHKLALDITRGMDYLHTLSIVHGDLKGDNILITDDGRAVIADFGISFVIGTTSFATSSSSSSRKGGTVRWQAPEVLSGGSNSFPADVYSLACVYFEVFDGTTPWGNLKDGAVIKNVCFEKKHPPYPRFLGLTRHAKLWREVMTACWAYEPQDRPTLLSIMASLHATENMPMTESKWDKSVPIRLRDPLVHGNLLIPAVGLPRFFGLYSPPPEVPS